MTTLILPGVGGSEPEHWQNWPEEQLDDATRWGAKLVDLGHAGHINAAAGFGAWPQVITELNTLKSSSKFAKPFLHQHATLIQAASNQSDIDYRAAKKIGCF